jgi:hypothetical protein
MCARSNHASDLFVILSAGRRKCCCSGAPTPTTQGGSRERPYRMDLSASANCRPDDASANRRPEDPANCSSRVLPRLVQQPPNADRHVDVPGICASNLDSVYQLGEVMGKGSFAVVKTARRKTDGKMYAIKILEKTNPGELWAMGHFPKRTRPAPRFTNTIFLFFCPFSQGGCEGREGPRN